MPGSRPQLPGGDVPFCSDSCTGLSLLNPLLGNKPGCETASISTREKESDRKGKRHPYGKLHLCFPLIRTNNQLLLFSGVVFSEDNRFLINPFDSSVFFNAGLALRGQEVAQRKGIRGGKR